MIRPCLQHRARPDPVKDGIAAVLRSYELPEKARRCLKIGRVMEFFPVRFIRTLVLSLGVRIMGCQSARPLKSGPLLVEVQEKLASVPQDSDAVLFLGQALSEATAGAPDGQGGILKGFFRFFP